MPVPFTIPPAVASEVPLLLQFIRDLAEHEGLTHACVVDEASLRAAHFGPRPCAEALLGFAGGEPAAFAIFIQNFSTFPARPGLHLEDLFVRPAYRRRGYARAMLTHLAREANRRGCGRLEWAVLDGNQPAIDTYLRSGASILPDWRVYRLAGDALERFGRGD